MDTWQTVCLVIAVAYFFVGSPIIWFVWRNLDAPIWARFLICLVWPVTIPAVNRYYRP